MRSKRYWVGAIRPVVLGTLLLAGVNSIQANEPDLTIRYPDDAGIVDVTKPPYNADNTGKTDATESLQRAISDHVGAKHPKFLYLPAGTYRLTDTLFWRKFDERSVPQKWGAHLGLVGENRERTILKLDDNLPAFNRSHQKAVLYTANMEGDSGNTAFYNHLRNFTVDVGSGNKMAVGIDWQSHNQGSLREVTVRAPAGSGLTGISLERDAPGPHLIKNVKIEGFDWAIRTAKNPTYSVWMEQVSIERQSVGGIHVGDQSVAIRRLDANLSGAAVVSDAGSKSHLVILDSTFRGGSASRAAVEVGGSVLLRDVDATASSYPSLLRMGKHAVPTDKRIEEFAGDAWKDSDPRSVPTLFDDSPKASLRLPIRETPVFNEADLTKWVNVAAFGAKPGTLDSSAAIQSAIDSTLPGQPNHGKTVLYFPPSPDGSRCYLVKDPLTVRGSLRKIEGLSNRIQPMPGGRLEAERGGPVMVVGDVEADTLFIEDLEINSTNGVTGFSIARDAAGKKIVPAYTLVHASKVTLVLKRVTCGYRAADGAGSLFAEDVVSGINRFAPGQQAWLRHFNSEGYDDFKIRCDGATVWMFGLKCEWLAPEMLITGRGKVEVLGAFFYPVRPTPNNHISMIVKDGDLSFSGKFYAWNANAIHDVAVEETQLGVTRRLPASAFVAREAGWTIPLYRSGSGTSSLGYEAPPDPSRAGNLVFGASVTVSSSYHGPDTPARLVDGDSQSARSRWLSKSSASTEWIELDLRHTQEFGILKLWFEGKPTSFRLLTQSGTGDWIELTSQVTVTDSVASSSFPPVRTQRVRIEFPVQKDIARLYEVGLYAP